LPKSQVLSVKSDFKGNWGGKTKPDVGLFDPDKISGGRPLREVIIVRLTLAQLISYAKVNLTIITWPSIVERCFTFVFLANVNLRSRSLYAIVRPSVCLSSVTLVRPTQTIEIFGNVSTPFNTLAIRLHSGKILRRSSQEFMHESIVFCTACTMSL